MTAGVKPEWCVRTDSDYTKGRSWRLHGDRAADRARAAPGQASFASFRLLPPVALARSTNTRNGERVSGSAERLHARVRHDTTAHHPQDRGTRRAQVTSRYSARERCDVSRCTTANGGKKGIRGSRGRREGVCSVAVRTRGSGEMPLPDSQSVRHRAEPQRRLNLGSPMSPDSQRAAHAPHAQLVQVVQRVQLGRAALRAKRRGSATGRRVMAPRAGPRRSAQAGRGSIDAVAANVILPL